MWAQFWPLLACWKATAFLSGPLWGTGMGMSPRPRLCSCLLGPALFLLCCLLGAAFCFLCCFLLGACFRPFLATLDFLAFFPARLFWAPLRRALAAGLELNLPRPRLLASAAASYAGAAA